MNVCFVVPSFPLPLNSGGNVAVYHAIEALARRGHAVTLFALAGSEVRPAELARMRGLCAGVHVHRRGRARALVNSLLHPTQAYWVASRRHGGMWRALARFLDQGCADVLHIEHSNMAYYRSAAPPGFPACLTFEALTHISFGRIATHADTLARRAIFALDAVRLRWYESRLLRRDSFSMYFFYSSSDQDWVTRRFPSLATRCVLLPVSVGAGAASGAAAPFRHPGVADGDKVLLLVGSMDNPSNEDAARWFAKRIFPALRSTVPNARFMVVGTGSRRRLADLDDPGVVVVGEVPELAPFLKRADVCVVPQRGGAGIRVKLLDSLAAGRVTVATPVGVEAMPDIRAGEHYLLARDENEFAARCLDVLRDPGRFETVAQAGRELVRRRYSPGAVATELENAYTQILSGGGRPSAGSAAGPHGLEECMKG